MPTMCKVLDLTQHHKMKKKSKLIIQTKGWPQDLPSAAASVAKDTSILLLTTPDPEVYLSRAFTCSPTSVLPKEHRDDDVILYQE